MPDQQPQASVLSPGAQALVDLAQAKQKQGNHERLGTHHWMLALLERHGPMAEDLAEGIETEPLQRQLQADLKRGELGAPLDVDALVFQAAERARARGQT